MWHAIRSLSVWICVFWLRVIFMRFVYQCKMRFVSYNSYALYNWLSFNVHKRLVSLLILTDTIYRLSADASFGWWFSSLYFLLFVFGSLPFSFVCVSFLLKVFVFFFFSCLCLRILFSLLYPQFFPLSSIVPFIFLCLSFLLLEHEREWVFLLCVVELFMNIGHEDMQQLQE